MVDAVFAIELLDAKANHDYIVKALEKNGFDKEHNIHGFYSYVNKDETAYFLCFDKEEMYGILAYKKDAKSKDGKRYVDWYLYSDILAPESLRLSYMKAFLDYCFKDGARKVWMETKTDFRDRLLSELKKEGKYKSNPIRYKLWTPVYNLQTWTGDKMEGSEWKDMRYYLNKFMRDHKVEFLDAKDVDKKAMKDLVRRWNKERTSGDRADCNHYDLIIDSGFEGYTHNRIMIVDGKVSAITAGFKSSDGKDYYSAIGIYTREFERIGEVANMDDLKFLKSKGYHYVDFGNGEEKLTEFKKKFKPEHIYETYYYSIVPKKAGGKV